MSRISTKAGGIAKREMGKECPAYELIATHKPFPDMQMNTCGGRGSGITTSLNNIGIIHRAFTNMAFPMCLGILINKVSHCEGEPMFIGTDAYFTVNESCVEVICCCDPAVPYAFNIHTLKRAVDCVRCVVVIQVLAFWIR